MALLDQLDWRAALRDGLPSLLDSPRGNTGQGSQTYSPTESIPPVNTAPVESPTVGGMNLATIGMVVGGLVAAVLLVRVLK